MQRQGFKGLVWGLNGICFDPVAVEGKSRGGGGQVCAKAEQLAPLDLELSGPQGSPGPQCQGVKGLVWGLDDICFEP